MSHDRSDDVPSTENPSKDVASRPDAAEPQPKPPQDDTVDASPPPDVDPLLDALDTLCAAARVRVDRHAARSAIEQALKETAFEGQDAWKQVLERTGPRLGLHVQSFQGSPGEIMRGFGRRQLPFVTMRVSDGECLAIVEHRGSRVRVKQLGSTRSTSWMGEAALMEALGTDRKNSACTWVFADPNRPMDAISSHDHHGHPTPVQRLWGLLRVESDEVTVVFAYAVGVGIMSLATPLGVQVLVNTLAFGAFVQPIVVLTLLVFVAIGLASLLRGLQAWVVERIQRRVFARVAIDLAHRLPRASIEAFDETHGPELVNRFFDVLTVQKGAALLLVDGISVVLAVVVGTLILAFYHPFLLVLDIVIVTVVVGTIALTAKRATNTSIEESKAKYAVAAWLEEIVRHPVGFKSAGGSRHAEARGKDLVSHYITAREHHFSLLFRQIVVFLSLQAFATAALLGVGGWLVSTGKLTLGQLVAAELIVTAVVAGLAKFGKYLESVYDLLAAVDKLGHLIDVPLEPMRGGPLRRTNQGIHLRMKGVSFEYAGTPVLQDVDLDIEPGARVIIVGEHGAGKSTLADIVYALRSPTAGFVEMDSCNLRDLDVEDVRDQIALVRDVEIFEGTIADNVRMGRPNLHTEDIREALDRVGLWDVVNAFPGGMETPLLTGGTLLSAGHARRLVLARAIAGKPRLVVVDDAWDAIHKEMYDVIAGPWTLLVLAHERGTRRAGERVIVLEEGTLREEAGT